MFSKSIKLSATLVAVAMLSTASAQDAAHSHQHAPGYVPGQATYPQLNAPLYPSPVQHTPAWNGGTIITNQAFAPHEMLYPHQYHAMYGPYYYSVKGGWVWTPFGVRQHEEVKLQGTEVIVKYKSHYPLFSGFRPNRNDKSLVNCFLNK